MTLLLAGALLLQNQSAEEVLKNIEEKLISANTLMVKFTMEQSFDASGNKWSSHNEGTLAFKESNKANLFRISKDKESPRESTFILDGNELYEVSGRNSAKLA